VCDRDASVYGTIFRNTLRHEGGDARGVAVIDERRLRASLPLLQIEDGELLNQLLLWPPDAAIREKILAANVRVLIAARKSGPQRRE